MASETTTPPREAVRRAVPCWMYPSRRPGNVYGYEGTPPVKDDDVPALAIDNATGGGLVARVRAALCGVHLPRAYDQRLSRGDVDAVMAAVCGALGVTP